MEGGNLTHNLRSKKVDWYRKGKKVRQRACSTPAAAGWWMIVAQMLAHC
jgi:hypothetical protein